MAYQALYRTYRPKNFDEVAGQEHITKTFKNALLNNKIAHAYLFSGPRGTGKTSVAKIIAKAVNCEHAPVANPCNECETCKGIDTNVINDVIEIDAASNNGVDEIREIRDKVKYLPGVGAYKVYIVDEVHMLSQGAFNALLKTLEEPPKHVIFILATTEPHKIPPTIHSRCQRFDFRGIGLEDMLNKLKEIIEKEAIAIDDEALHLIAETAEGGMRDAISLLDQVYSYSNDAITVAHVHAIRGSIEHSDITQIAQAIEEERVVDAMDVLETLIISGKETIRILDDMLKFYRDILMIKSGAYREDYHPRYRKDAFKKLIETMSTERIFHYIDMLHDAMQKTRYAGSAKLFIELAFVKMIDFESKKEIVAMEKLNALEMGLHELQTKVADLAQKWEQEPKEISDGSTFSDFVESANKPIEETEVKEPQKEEIKTDEEVVEPQPEPKRVEKPKDIYTKLYEQHINKPYQSFDIHYVEDVLNTADRAIKIDMIKKWFDLERVSEGENLDYAKMITSGALAATNGVMVIATYDSIPLCNKLMSPEVKPKIINILEKYYKRKLMFMALPVEVWKTIESEFVKKFRAKKDPDDFIRLTAIKHPKLKDIPKEEENFADVESLGAKEAKDLFGDIVKIKKEGE